MMNVAINMVFVEDSFMMTSFLNMEKLPILKLVLCMDL